MWKEFKHWLVQQDAKSSDEVRRNSVLEYFKNRENNIMSDERFAKKKESGFIDLKVDVANGTTFERVRKSSIESWRDSDTDAGKTVVFLTSGRVLKVTNSSLSLDAAFGLSEPLS